MRNMAMSRWCAHHGGTSRIWTTTTGIKLEMELKGACLIDLGSIK